MNDQIQLTTTILSYLNNSKNLPLACQLLPAVDSFDNFKQASIALTALHFTVLHTNKCTHFEQIPFDWSHTPYGIE